MSSLKDAVNDFIAGSTAGAASVTVGHPMDTIKIRLQLYGSDKYKGSIDCFQKMVKEEGVKSLFRGMLAPLVSSSIINAILFASYGSVLKWLSPSNDINDTTHLQRFLAGSISAVPQSFILCPTDLIKIKLQQDSSLYANTIDCFKKYYRTLGLRALFQGQCATLIRDMPALGSYFSSYHFCNDEMKKHVESEVITSFISGAIAGAVSWCVVYPMDVVKSTIQSLPLTVNKSELKVWYVLRNIYNKYGWKQLYRGMGISILRSLPVNAVVFPVYEATRKLLDTLHI